MCRVYMHGDVEDCKGREGWWQVNFWNTSQQDWEELAQQEIWNEALEAHSTSITNADEDEIEDEKPTSLQTVALTPALQPNEISFGGLILDTNSYPTNPPATEGKSYIIIK